MDITDISTEHDLTLRFDQRGRLWRLRPTPRKRRPQPIDAHQTEEAVVITLRLPGIEPGDVDLAVDDGVLEIREKAVKADGFACDVDLPRRVDVHAIRETYTDGALEVLVPKTTVTSERIPVASGPIDSPIKAA
jgi:HSP20 family molecular chaperone IbpA